MARCPECDAKIYTLEFEGKVSGNVFGEYNEYGLDISDDPEFDYEDLEDGYEEMSFSCPECGEILFENKEDADEFLEEDDDDEDEDNEEDNGIEIEEYEEEPIETPKKSSSGIVITRI